MDIILSHIERGISHLMAELQSLNRQYTGCIAKKGVDNHECKELDTEIRATSDQLESLETLHAQIIAGVFREIDESLKKAARDLGEKLTDLINARNNAKEISNIIAELIGILGPIVGAGS